MPDYDFIIEAIEKYGDRLFEVEEDPFITPLVEFVELASDERLSEEETNALLDYVFEGVSESIINEVSAEFAQKAAVKALGKRKNESNYARYAQNLTKNPVLKQGLEKPKMDAQSRLNKAKDIASGKVNLAKNYNNGNYKRPTSQSNQSSSGNTSSNSGNSALNKLKSTANSVKNFFKVKDDSPVGLKKIIGSTSTSNTGSTSTSNTGSTNTQTEKSSGGGEIKVKNKFKDKSSDSDFRVDSDAGNIKAKKVKFDKPKEEKPKEEKTSQLKLDLGSGEEPEKAGEKKKPEKKTGIKRTAKKGTTGEEKKTPKKKETLKSITARLRSEEGLKGKALTTKARDLYNAQEALCDLATLLTYTNISESSFVEIMELLLTKKAVNYKLKEVRKKKNELLDKVNNLVKSQAGMQGKNIKDNPNISKAYQSYSKQGEVLDNKERSLINKDRDINNRGKN